VTANPEFDRQLEENRRGYAAMREEIRAKYAGQYVGFAFGRVAAAGPDFHEVCRSIDRLDPAPQHHVVFWAEAVPDFDGVQNLSVEFSE
jgi:hypothetical protein